MTAKVGHCRFRVSTICACWLILAISGGILGAVSTYTFLYALGMTTEQLSIRSLVMLPGSFVAVPVELLNAISDDAPHTHPRIHAV